MLPSYEAGQAQAYVAEKGWRAKRSGDEIVLEVCPMCGGKDWRTYINDESGLFKCHHGKCGAVGNFYTLRKHLGDLPAADPYVPVAVAKKRHTAELLSFEVALEVDEDAKSYLASRGIDMATAKAWHFGVKTDEHGVKWLMIPYLVNDVVGDIKYRSLPPAPKQFHRLKGGDSILFGGHQLADAQGRTTLYLVEGELDCVTLWQHGYWPAVSTTTGAGSFKVAWYDAIVAFDPKEIVICYDSDTAGQKGAEALLKKFEDRLVKNIVLPEAKDANEYFGTHSNADFDALLAAARPPELENAKSMTTVLNMLQEQLWFSANAFDGVPSMFDEVNTMIAGGYWRGQLVTISGSSGTGKTSYVLQELLTMAKQGHPAYLLCLEMPEVMMMRKIIEKEYGVPMMQITEAHVQKYRVDLEQIPFYMGSKGGGAGDQLDMVEATIRAAVRRYDLRCVAFDNINFFVRSIEHATQEIARVTKRMKELAVDLNVPIIQIAQPRKFDESARMMIGSDLKDSSAIEQDSDTIMLLHRARIKTEVKDVGKSAGFAGNRSPYCLVRVDKARYAAGGECLMHFDGSRSTFRELTLGEREAMARP